MPPPRVLLRLLLPMALVSALAATAAQQLRLLAAASGSRELLAQEHPSKHEDPRSTPAVQQLSLVLPTTFKDTARALASLASVRQHMAAELLYEALLVCPFQEYLVLRHALAPTIGGRTCPTECYLGGSRRGSDRNTSGSAPQGYNTLPLPPGGASRAVAALQAAGLLPAPNGGGSECARQPYGSDVGEGTCGAPLWVIPEHLALGVSRSQLATITPIVYGYRLQMALKLTVSSLVSTRFYLVLDSDVLMVRDVGPHTAHWLFPRPGRAIYQPQRRAMHAKWWDVTSVRLGLGRPASAGSSSGAGEGTGDDGGSHCFPTDPEARVFGVTPAILATQLAEATVQYWDERLGNNNDHSGGSGKGMPTATSSSSRSSSSSSSRVSGSNRRLAAMRVMLPKRAPFWTEYCSYALVAECHLGRGTLARYHAPRQKPHRAAPSPSTAPVVAAGAAGAVPPAGVAAAAAAAEAETAEAEAPRLYRGLWRRGGGNWSAADARMAACSDCIFLVVQSNVGVDVRRVVGDMEHVFGGEAEDA